MVAAGSEPGGRAALAWVVVLGLGPGVWVLPCAPGGSPACAWGVWVALDTPQYGWVGAGPGAGLVALGPPMCPQVFWFFLGVEVCGGVGRCFSPVGGGLGGPG